MNKNRKIIVLFVLLLLFWVLLKYMSNNHSNEYILEYDSQYMDGIINDEETDVVNYGDIINDLRNEYNNDDVKGVLEISNSDYVVPIMQGIDNEYYLNHTPDGKTNFMGSIYLDYRVDIDNSKKLLIFGHNSSNVDMPFKILENYYDKDYYNNHKYIEIITESGNKRYEIFSVFVEVEDFSYMKIDYESDYEYLLHINKLKSKSIYDIPLELTENDEILILQTCSTHKDYMNYSKKYLLVISKRV